MKRSWTLVIIAVLMATHACKKQDESLQTPPLQVNDPRDLDLFIQEKTLANNEFRWEWASNEQIWTALSNSDYVLSVGYQPAGVSNVTEHLHEIDFNNAAWRDARSAVWALILESERQVNPKATQATVEAYQALYLPVLDVRVQNPATIDLLRKSPLVRYAEPIGYEPFMKDIGERSSSGCGSNTPTGGLVLGSDYNDIAPGCKQSWNHSYHNVTQAWNNSTGAGAHVMIVDTGSSDDQDNLGGEFDQGFSAGRSINRIVTLPQATNFWGSPTGSPETPNDLCGHGTAMSGACAAPRGVDGAATGIAYGANLTTVRAAVDVFLDESREVVGVSNAFTIAGNTPDIRIVSMSMGRITSSSQMRDAITYAYNQGKLIFCAAGTSYSWTAWFAGVIFPATLSQAVAVTGIRDNLTSKCGNCHVGSKVDFVVVMEKVSNDLKPLSLDMDSNAPSTVGGSSVATASTAGIAALVWAKYPSWTRTQVYDRLKMSSNYYPSRNSNFGWGRINAQTATN
jgi:subtilisin family serine protease